MIFELMLGVKVTMKPMYVLIQGLWNTHMMSGVV